MRTFFHLCLTTLLSTVVLSAGEPEPLSFFPHNVGDTWAYQYEGTTVLNSIITSVQKNEEQELFLYLNNNAEPAYKITNNLDVYFSPTHNPHLDYKLTAHEGSSWTVTTYSNSKLMARVQQVYTTLVFGQPSTIMAINYYEVPDPDTVITDSSPYRYTHFLASEFGFIRQLGESGDVPIELVGCIINGRTFGTVTDVQEQQNDHSLSMTVAPNPCSSLATFHCSLPSGATEAHLSITDVFGNSVYTADIDNDQYTIDTSILSNGFYFCTLTVGVQTRTLPIVVQQ